MKILFVSHTPSGGPFVVGSHHLAKAFSSLGNQVLHISPPVTPAHFFLCRQKFERERFCRCFNLGTKRNGFIDFVPFSFLPWGAVRRLSSRPANLMGALTRRSVLKAVKKYGFEKPDLIFIDEPRLAATIECFEGCPVVYRPTDLYAQIRNDGSVDLAERYLLRKANAFIATSQPVKRHLEDMGAEEVLLVENGVDTDIFDAHRLKGIDRHRQKHRSIAVYAGALDRRFGTESLLAAAMRCADTKFVIAGPYDAKMEKELRLENIELIGPKKFEDLPELFQSADVALLPLSDEPSNQGRSPMKLFEYAAAGLPVVATKTPELARRALKFVLLANSPAEFADHVEGLVSHRVELPSGLSDAIQNSWKAKAELILNYAVENAAKLSVSREVLGAKTTENSGSAAQQVS